MNGVRPFAACGFCERRFREVANVALPAQSKQGSGAPKLSVMPKLPNNTAVAAALFAR